MKLQRVAMGGVYGFPLAALAALFVIFNTTDPVSIGPIGILAVFVLVYFLCLDLIFICLHAMHRLKARLAARGTVAAGPARPAHYRRSYYIASVVAFAPVFLLAMQTIGQLQLRDIALVVVFITIAVFYVAKRS